MIDIRKLLIPVFVVGFTVGACGGTDSSEPEAADVTSGSNVVDDHVAESTTTAASGAGRTGTASVEIAGSTHEFAGAEICEIGAPGTADVSPTNPSGRTAEAMFADGDDNVLLHVHEAGITPVVTVDGADYEGYGRAPLVEITDTDVVWTGEMSADAGETLEAVTISISCAIIVK